MADVQRDFAEALGHYNSGRFDKAYDVARRIARHIPDHPDLLSLMGLSALQSGRNDEAIPALARVAQLRPSVAATHSNLGEALRRAGRLGEATTALRRALQIDPSAPDAHNNLGVVQSQAGDESTAAESFARAVSLKPDYADALCNWSSSLRALKRTGEAVTVARRAVASSPAALAPQMILARSLLDNGNRAEAIDVLRAASSGFLNEPEPLTLLGVALHAAGRAVEAVEALTRANQIRPDQPDCLYALGDALDSLHRYSESAALYQRALELSPAMSPARYALGGALGHVGRLSDAIACFRGAAECDPSDAAVHGNVLFGMLYEPHVSEPALLDEHARWWRSHGAPHAPPALPWHSGPFRRHDRDPERKPLRVGYVSPNFRGHPVTFFVLPILANHRRDEVMTLCYSDAAAPDAYTQRIRSAADAWRDTQKLNDDELARLIRDDRIDLLVDLTQHLANNRMPLFARKPAPVQLTYLGYPYTTGLPTMDYRLTDPHLDPDPVHSAGPETLLYLPESYFCYGPPPDAPPITHDVASARQGVVTFGSINQLMKINDGVVETWSRVLASVPGSRLLLKAQGFGDPRACEDFVARFARHGVAADRIETQGMSPLREAMAELHRVDVVLDTFPYPGGTTTCHVLWMGVPVVTMAGRLPFHRMGVSVLNNVGLDEQVARDAEQFVTIAVALANDVERRRELLRSMRSRMDASPLMDGPRFARHLEPLYRRVWTAWCEGTDADAALLQVS
jgi:predicted O-linked N-acetylglucosamine transferase (SPINDLY family)